MKQSLKSLHELTSPLVISMEDDEKSYYSCLQTHGHFLCGYMHVQPCARETHSAYLAECQIFINTLKFSI